MYSVCVARSNQKKSFYMPYCVGFQYSSYCKAEHACAKEFHDEVAKREMHAFGIG